MSDEQMERLLRRFAIAARKHHEAMEALDEDLANRHAVVVARLAASIQERGEAGRTGLLSLTWSDDDCVAGMAAVYSMRSNTARAVAVLRKIVARGGLLGFRASVALERWEKGEWGPD